MPLTAMPASCLLLLHQDAPWLAPLRPALDSALRCWRQSAALASPVARALNQALALAAQPAAAPLAAALPPRFVPQTDLPTGESYEAFIHRTGQVPTRDNLHDFFNGLVWLAFPQAKQRLNQLQAQAMQHQV